MSSENKIVLFRRKAHLNLGIILFGIILIYLVVMVTVFFTTNRVKMYEVRLGSVINDVNYTGIALRDEIVVPASRDGYINYYNPEKTKIKAGSKLYITTSKKAEFTAAEKNNEESNLLPSETQDEVTMLVDKFNESFKESDYSSVYTLKSEIQRSVSHVTAQERYGHLDQLLISDPSDITLDTAVEDGVIVYTADGYENLTKDDITQEVFSGKDYVSMDFHNNMKVKKGDPVYKLVRSDQWMVVVPINDHTAKELEKRKAPYVNVRFSKDNEILKAKFTIETLDGQKMAYLSFDSSAIRYADQRFIDLEMVMEDEEGLKIPKSSVVEKTFYTIPEDYLIQGGNDNKKGVLRKKSPKSQSAKFVPVKIYNVKESTAYIYSDEIDQGDVLKKENSEKTQVIEKTKKLKGVYKVDKGYAEFKPIDILTETNDYYIISTGNSYGLSNFDHIALNGNKVKENDIISQ